MDSSAGFYSLHLRGLSDSRIWIKRNYVLMLLRWLQRSSVNTSGEVDFVWSAEPFQNHSLGRAAYLRVYIDCACLRIHFSSTGDALLLGSMGGSGVLSGSVIDYMGLKAPIKMNVVINKANLYYEIHGQGEPLLLLQGWGMDITGWEYIIEPLSNVFQVIVFDNRGAGRSEVTPGNYTTRLLADDAAALLDHLRIDTAHVLGWSMGGMIAQELVLAYPRKVNRLILSASSAKVTAKSSFIAWSNIEAINRGEMQTAVNWQLSFCFSKALFANEAMLFEIKENALNPLYPITYDGLISQFAAVASHDRRRQLRSIKSPTLVLGAKEDGIIGIDQVKALAREIDHSELRILPGGHMYHVEYSDIFARTVIEFLQDPAYASGIGQGVTSAEVYQ